MKFNKYSLINITRNLALLILICSTASFARDITYQGTEVDVFVSPGEPTQVTFPGEIQGGFKKNVSALHLDRKDSDLIVFANEGIDDRGEAIIVRLKDGRSYSVRVKVAEGNNSRDDVIEILDKRRKYTDKEELKSYQERNYGYAPPTTVSGLMRDMILVAEFGKPGIPGYKISDRYKGETVLSDGTVIAKIDQIFLGSKYWGYVIDTSNLLDQTQRLNPASFRIDGTRAISASRWELTGRPLNIEQQLAAKDKTKVYVITKARQN